MRYLRAQDHRHDIDLARVVLLVCAVGARDCDDPRVCLVSSGGGVDWGSAGWIYFSEVHQMQSTVSLLLWHMAAQLTVSALASCLMPPKLADLQIAALTAIYLQGASRAHPAWVAVGQGLRVALNLGAHREKTYQLDSKLDMELWKRSFW